MSLMICGKCGCQVDTDFDDFNFDDGICTSCTERDLE